MVEHIKNNPMPPYRKRGARSIYRWNEMAIGQCFKFPPHVSVESARRMAFSSGRTYDMKFSVRLLDNGECWCWRVPDHYRETRNPNSPIEVEVRNQGPADRRVVSETVVGWNTTPPIGDGTDDPI